MLYSVYPAYCFLGMNALHLSVAKTRKNMPKSSIKKVCGFKVRRCELEGLLKVSLGDSK